MHLALLDTRPRLIAWELVWAAATLTAALLLRGSGG